MQKKKAFITGITGQDGAILAQILLHKNYEVHGLRHYLPVPDDWRIADIQDIHLHYGDMTDSGNLTRLIETIKPDEIYNMAALSHVHVSFNVPEATADINALGPLRILETLRTMDTRKDIKFYQASSSEMFGRSPAPQSEDTKFEPCSPYGSAKLFAYWTVRNYREAYDIFAANGILFNHESPLRGEEFVTRKITKTIPEIEAGVKDKIRLGNLDAKRDWGHARDYMEGIWQIMQHNEPDDFVLATGQAKTVREFVETAFAYIGHNIVWDGDGLNETGRDGKTGKILVEIDPTLFRPQEVHNLLGDATKAKNILGWQATTSFENLVRDMIDTDRLVKFAPKTHAA